MNQTDRRESLLVLAPEDKLLQLEEALLLANSRARSMLAQRTERKSSRARASSYSRWICGMQQDSQQTPRQQTSGRELSADAAG